MHFGFDEGSSLAARFCEGVEAWFENASMLMVKVAGNIITAKGTRKEVWRIFVDGY